MLNAAAGHDSNVGTKGQLLLVDEQSNTEQGLRSTIQALERRGDASRGDLVASLIKLGKLTQEKGNHTEAEGFFRRALEAGPGALPPKDPRLLPALTGLAGYHVLRGAFDDAAALVSRALSISERNADEDQSDLAILLNDLARICLKQSAYTLAEPLLTRLLAIKQSKGENHPEVATVLASLAAVRGSLGQHESAERLWRRVLDIRERNLAPNHFSVASALEHLAESCAARGKIEEALQLYQRAQTIRQLTLGSNHASLRISRDRIADLQLQASEDSEGVTPAPSAPVSPPEGFRLRIPAEQRLISPVPLVPPTTDSPSIAVEKHADRIVVPEAVQSVVADAPAWEPQAEETADRDTMLEETGVAPYQNILLSIAQELGDEYEEAGAQSFQDRGNLAWVSGFLLQHKRNVAIAGAATAVILVLAWAWNTKADGQAAVVSADLQPPMAFAASSAVPTGSRRPASDSQTTPTALRTTPPASVRNKVSQVSEAVKKGSDRKEANSVTIPKLSARTMLNVDSAVSAAGAGTKSLAESITPDFGSALPSPPLRSTFDTGEPLQVSRAHRAILIGSLPAPTLPNYSSGLQGEVVVSFTVDTEGRPAMSTVSVVRSPDPMLSSAVRKVISSLRFEPAQTAGPDPKRVADTVQVTYRFAQNPKQ